MKIISSYISGLKMSGRYCKMSLFIYSINLILGLVVALPFLGAIKNGFGSSMLPDALLQGFDFTALTEFIRQSAKSIGGFFIQMRWIIFLYLVLSILFSGGILNIFNQNEKYSSASFLFGCSKYFFRFTKLFLYIILLNILIALIIYLPLVFIVKAVGKSADSESTLFFIVLTGVLIHLILFIILQIVSFYTKIYIVTHDTRKVFISVFRSIGFVFKHFIRTFSLFIMLIITSIILILIFYILKRIIGTGPGSAILIMFFIQQAFIFSRVFIRNWFYGSQYVLFNGF